MFWYRRRSRTDLASLSMLFVIVCCASDGINAQQNSETGKNVSTVEHGSSKICNSMTFKVTPDRWGLLRNCNVIEGSLTLAVVQNPEGNVTRGVGRDINDESFPDLREISDYLLVFRTHFTNLTRLFPNLAVIRGERLLDKYALVIYENSHMTSIGLSNLTAIKNGGVRIEKNQRLCHVHSVDWKQITHSPGAKIILEQNQDANLCPGCDKSCPMNHIENRPLCWSYRDCQKTCAIRTANTTACMRDGKTACHEECLGGCTGKNAADCVACRNFLFRGQCLDKCPSNTYTLYNRRCLEKDECINYDTKSSRRMKATMGDKSNLCSLNCPDSFMESPDDPTVCVKCNPTCPKTCSIRRTVDSVRELKKLKGCTIIDGSLSIEIKAGDNVTGQMLESLEHIEEIRGYLSLARTPAMVSFEFFKSLRIIHGETLHLTKYALVVLDNMNLQEFWDWDEREKKKKTFKINNGALYFYHNERLCYQKIVELKNRAGLENLTLDNHDVSRETNGDRMSCDVFPLSLQIANRSATEVYLIWDKPEATMLQLDDHRYLYAYTIFYMELDTDAQNVTEFYGRDACGKDPWNSRDTSLDTTDADDQQMIFKMDDLQPFKHYAVYVKTNVIAQSRKTAKSDIKYFWTLMAQPSAPQNLKLESTAWDKLNVHWEKPARPHGDARMFLVTAEIQRDEAALMTEADICTQSDLGNGPTPKLISVTTNTKNTTVEPSLDYCSKCKCAAIPKKSKQSTEELHDAIDFEDLLHDLIFTKREQLNGNGTTDVRTTNVVTISRKKRDDGSDSRTKRGAPKPTPSSALENFFDGCPKNRTDTEMEGANRTIKICTWTTDQTMVLENLKHFSQYMVEVRACNPLDKVSRDSASYCDIQLKNWTEEGQSMCCGPKKVAFKRTLRKPEADDIDGKTFRIEDNVNNSTDDVFPGGVILKWSPPNDPNAFIQKYDIQYYADGNTLIKNQACVNLSNYERYGGTQIKIIAPGNYSFRVRAISVGGPGNWTQPKSFVVKEAQTQLTSLIVSIIVIMLVLILSIALAGFFYFKKRLSQPIPDKVQYASINPEYMSQIYEPDEYEVPREKVKLLHELGQGSFGMVWQGIVFDLKNFSDPKGTDCAVKTVKEGAKFHERQEFLKEASTMKSFDSYHVVKLLGVVSKDQPLYVIMELMSNGDLKRYLRSHRPDQDEAPKGDPPTLQQVLQMAAEIADGMAYLGSLKFVHRDLAARNCMVADDLTVKIGDFGMTRDIYETDYYKKGGKGLLPVRWMSPEALKDGLFTVQGDVWSYGVVLWEIVTLATMPYQGLSHEQVLRWVISRHIMERPENCPDKLFEIMKHCWHYNPKLRPKFVDIVEMLLDDTHDRFRELSYYSTKVRPLQGEAPPTGRARAPSVESLPLLARPSSHVATTGLQSLIENPRNAVDMGAADLDEESNLYISDDVISDGEAEDSGPENWANPGSHRHSQPGSSIPKHNNSDYGSGKSPTIPLLLESGDVSHSSPPTTATAAVLPSSSPTINMALPQERRAQAEKRNKVAANGAIQPNGRIVCIPINNRTTAF